MTRYHPLLVALHWLMALLILLALAAGKLLLAGMDNADPQKVEGLGGHMTVGLIIGALLLVRLAARAMSETPPPADAGSAFFNAIGLATHWILYLLIAGMVLSGLTTAALNGLFPIVFGGSGAPLPDGLSQSTPRVVHGVISNLLIALVGLHFAAALYHQFIRRDGLLRRMWFGKRRDGT